MPEWSIGAVSKTVERFAFQGFESLSLRKKKQVFDFQILALFLSSYRAIFGAVKLWLEWIIRINPQRRARWKPCWPKENHH